MLPAQPVARLQDMKSLKPPAGAGVGGYVAGQFYRWNKNRNLSAGTTKVGALVFRGEMNSQSVAVAKIGMMLEIGDRICTGPDTVLTVEFLIGGRVSVNKSTEIAIESERSVSDINGPTGLKALVGLFKSHELKQPIEIQTNGGTMGIKG